MEHTIKFFLKFGKEEHVRDLYENGTVYMNTLEYFRNIEDAELRGDSREGDVRIINSLPGEFSIPNIEGTFNYQKLNLRIKPITAYGNIYSLYCFSSFGFPDPLKFSIDERNYQFGSHCLMIKQCGYFLDQMEKNLAALNLPYNHGFVHYYDQEKVSQDLTVFNKPMGYEYQKEFRFFVGNDVLEPIKFQLGSLKNYAEIIDMNDLRGLKTRKQVR